MHYDLTTVFSGYWDDTKSELNKKNKNLELERIEKEDKERAIKQYYNDFNEQKEKFNKLKKKSMEFSIILDIVIVLTMLLCTVNKDEYNKHLAIIWIVIVGFVGIMYMVTSFQYAKDISTLKYTNTYNHYLITNNWKIEAKDLKICLEGKHVLTDAPDYILTVYNKDNQKEYTIKLDNVKMYEKLSKLPNKEVIVIDLMNTEYRKG